MGVHQDSDTYKKVKELLDIPPNEPIFILRAQDKFSIQSLETYYRLVWWGLRETTTSMLFSWEVNIKSVISDFKNWQRDNPEKVKVPD